MCLFAGAFAVAALYVPGVTLLLAALVSAALVSAAARGARVELELSADRAEEGEPVTVTAHVSGGLAGACRGALRVLPGAAPVALDWRRQPAEQSLRTVRRGRATVGPATARWADPFGLCVRERTSATRELLVLPRVQRIRGRDLDRIASLPEPSCTHLGGIEVDGLRELIPGSPASRIHWLTLARTGVPMERRLSGGEDRRSFTIVLDARSAANDGALDMAVRAAASLCTGLAATGGCSVLLAGRPRVDDLGPGLQGWARLHELLALVEHGSAPRWELVRSARRVVLVAPGPVRAPAGIPVSCFVSPRPEPGAELLFNLAGCAVQAAGRTRAGRAA
jgi:uncharacterized protein (DUF58 family)